MSSVLVIRVSFEDYAGKIMEEVESGLTNFAHVRLAVNSGMEYFSRDFDITSAEKFDSILERVEKQLDRLESGE